MKPVRPLPHLRPGDEPMWLGLEGGELKVQRCTSCERFRYPPGPICPWCLADDHDWTAVSGRASLLSWVVFHRQYFPGMEPPYVVVAAELEEGPIVIADLVDEVGTGGAGEPLRLGEPLALNVELGEFVDGNARPIFQWRRENSPSS